MGRTAGGPSVSQWPSVEFGPWMPDIPALVNPGMKFAKNVYPKASKFYGPVRALETVSENTVFSLGLPIKISGEIHSFKRPDNGDCFYYAGSSASVAGNAQIYRYTESTRTWSDASQAGGYNVTVGRAWRFANMGPRIVGCAGHGTNMQTLSDGSSGLFTDLAAAAPQAVDVAVVNPGFLVALNILDDTYGMGAQYYRLWWSAIQDGTNWPEPGSHDALSVQSDFQDLLDGGRLHRIVPGIGGNDAVIVGERRIWKMNYVGAPKFFDFRVAEYDQGTTIPGSVTAMNKVMFYFGSGGFNAFNGENSTPIGRGVVDQTFQEELQFHADSSFQRAMCAGVDTDTQTVMWSYRTATSPNAFNNKLLMHNIVSGLWGTADLGVDAMGRVDNEASKTDSPYFVVMGQDFHLQRMTGLPLEAEIDTREIAVPGGGDTMVKGARPLIDAVDLYATPLTRDRISQTLFEGEEKGLEEDGVVPMDCDSARYFRVRCRVPQGVNWTDAIGVELEIAPGAHGPGRRG